MSGTTERISRKRSLLRRIPRFRVGKAGTVRQLVCLTVALNLLILPMPVGHIAYQALAQLDGALGVSRTVRQVRATLGPHLFLVRGFDFTIPIWIPSSAQSQATSPPDPSSVSSIVVGPGKHAAFVGDRVAYSAQPRDAGAAVVHGIKFGWSTLNPDKVSVDEAERATMLAPGLATIVCTAGLATGTALVLVRQGNRPAQTDAQWRLDQGSATASTGAGASASLVTPSDTRLAAWGCASLEANPVATARGTDQNSDGAPALLSSLAEKLIPTAHAQSGGGSGSAWTTNPWVIGAPRNGVIEPTRFGAVLPESFNYELAIPVVASVGNRELNIPLALYCNSQIWSTTGPTTMQFDPNQSWPAPGFSLGFGRIDTTLSGDQQTAYYTLVEPNGTRRYLGSGPASVTGAPPPYPTYWTNDGTYIAYVGDAVHGGELYYPSGAKYDINLVNNRLLVTQITSTNGNYVQVSYMHNTYDINGNPIPPVYSPFALNYVVDTLGRQINFGYDTSSGTGLLTSITGPAGGATLTYQQKNLVTNFYSNLYGQQMTVQGAPAAYFALTSVNAQQYYQMNWSDYGMVYGFTMGRSNTATVTFDYPTSGTTQLGGAPAFTQRTESSGSVTGTYAYSVSGVTSAITRPDTSTLTLTDNGSGLLAQSEVKLGTQSYAKMVYTYGNDPGGAPQVMTAKPYDDTGTPRRVDYSYDQHGNVTSKLEYGFQVNGPWLRKTTLTYAGAPYTTNFMLNRVTGVSVYDPNNNQIAGTSYSYDGYGSILTYSQQSTAPGHLSNYDSTYTLRGNITTVTRLTNVAQGTSTSRSATYDVFGNQVTINVDCCNQKSFTYNQDTYWSQPDQTTTGSGSTALTNSSSYNFNTSATTSRTDQNGLTTSYTDSSWLQPTQINPPGGANLGLGYGDWGDLTSDTMSYTDGGVNKSFSASAIKDGWGNPTQQADRAGNKVNLAYDNMGRLQSQTNPFPSNGTPGPTTSYQYDTLGRVTRVTLPDSSTVQTAYNGSTMTVTDQVGRQTQRQVDGLRRLVTVLEQDPSVGGAPSVATNYSYDYLDDLIQVNQGGQIRAWKYDSAKRLLYEQIPEQSATINDGTGAMWSCAYTYTNFDAVATKTDARGVVITYGYDSLNRLSSVSYDTSHAPGVASTPNVTYNYDMSTTGTTRGLLLSVTMGTFQESYSYDSVNRWSSVTDVIDGKSYVRSYQYNQASQVTQVTYPSQRVVPISYDSAGRLSSVGSTLGNPAGFISGMAYNTADQVSGFTLGNGVTEAFGYDSNRLQLTSQKATSPGGTSGNLMNLTYAYQASAGQMGTGTTAGDPGQLTGISGSINGVTENTNYTYDDIGRLATSAQTSNGASAQRRFVYDRWGNRTGVWGATSGGNQIQSVAIRQSAGAPTNQIQSITMVGTANYLYDPAGNLTNDGVHVYTYDALNRLVSIDSGTTAQYAYDASNRRIRRVVSGAITHYIWDGNLVLAEHDGSTGNVLQDYVNAGSAFLAKVNSNGTFYFIRDRLSQRLRLDSGGNVTSQMGHLPFGEDFGESGPQEKHHLTTYERDIETGSDYAVNRMAASSAGRFLSADPYRSRRAAATPQRWNRYSYAQNDPVNLIDSQGLDGSAPDVPTWWCWLEIFANTGISGSGTGCTDSSSSNYLSGMSIAIVWPSINMDDILSQVRQGVLKIATDQEKKALNNRDCDKLLSGPGGDAAAILQTMLDGNLIKIDDQRVAALAAQAGRTDNPPAATVCDGQGCPSIATENCNSSGNCTTYLASGAFNNDKTAKLYGAQPGEGLLLLLLHELAHATGNDENNIEKAQFNADIVTKCIAPLRQQ
ncbi:MAG TPA: RHS repeat-associated core domain-containing protein [Blastocatellia bacterium]|nr:RHS repeat-associated core domain-containing protein [Blastocatellia bacterium]